MALSVLSVPIRPLCRPQVLLLLALGALFITTAGCNTCDNTARPALTAGTARFQTNLVFDRFIVRSKPGYVDPQEFARAQWPRSERPYGYISSGETIHYRESRFSDQAVYGNNQVRTRLHNRLRSYRYGTIYR